MALFFTNGIILNVKNNHLSENVSWSGRSLTPIAVPMHNKQGIETNIIKKITVSIAACKRMQLTAPIEKPNPLVMTAPQILPEKKAAAKWMMRWVRFIGALHWL